MGSRRPICGEKNYIEDPNYRYLMPRVEVHIEGRGNGVKTVLDNVEEVASAIHRFPEEIHKFIGVTEGAEHNCDVKNRKYLVNGIFTQQRVQSHIHKFIDLFVLCGNCHYPETHYVMDERKNISQHCNACNAKTPLDVTSRLSSVENIIKRKYFLNQKSSKKNKKEKKLLGKPEEDEEDLTQPSSSTKKEKKEKKRKKGKEKKERKKR